MLKSPWRKEIVEGSFQDIGKKNLQELGRIAPECLNGSMRPQTSYIITPNPARNVFPFFPSELNQDWTSESCLRAPGAGEWVGATGFHFPCLDLIDFC